MKALRKLYLSKVAELLGECLDSWYSHPPPLWTKPMGHMRAVTVLLIQDGRSLFCQRVSGLELIGSWTESDKTYEGSISIEKAKLSNIVIESEFDRIEGINLFKLYNLRKKIRRFIDRSKIEYTTEMVRRYSYLEKIKKNPKTQLELVTSIFDKYCDTGPLPFSARDSLISLYGEEWSYSHNYYELEEKQNFILDSLVNDDILIKDGDQYRATPKIVKKLEELKKENDQDEEKRDAQTRTFMLQEKSVKTARYALYAAIFSGIAGAANVAVTIIKAVLS